MAEYFLIYDDTCSICRKSIETVKKFDKRGLIALVELSRPKLPDNLPLPSHEAISKQLHLYSREGELWVGADAVAHLALMFGPSKALRCILKLPGIRPLARRLYRLVARNRHLWHRIDK